MCGRLEVIDGGLINVAYDDVMIMKCCTCCTKTRRFERYHVGSMTLIHLLMLNIATTIYVESFQGSQR